MQISENPKMKTPRVGTSVTLSGSLSTPASGQLFVYALANGSSTMQIGTTYMINGSYSYVYNVSASGTYALYVVYPWDPLLTAVQSPEVTLTTLVAAGPDYVLYIIIIAVAAAGVGSFVAFRGRRDGKANAVTQSSPPPPLAQ